MKKRANFQLPPMGVEDVRLEDLARMIREEGRPVYINKLAYAAVRAWLEARLGKRCYAPGSQYTPGETIQFNGELVTVKSVRLGGNPRQGQFKVLTLMLPDGTERYMAAGVGGAPSQDKNVISDREIRAIIADEEGIAIRAVVQEALSRDSRFVWFQDDQDDQWCLEEMLPSVGDRELAKVADALVRELQNGEPVSKTTEELVQAAWGAGDDGSNLYALRAFALGRVLLSCIDVEYLGGRWVWAETWKAFTEREPLRSPVGRTRLDPSGKMLILEAEAEEGSEGETAKSGPLLIEEEVNLEDLEAWRRHRPRQAVFTLSARHYYEGWLPLTAKTARLFPPLAAGRQEVLFHYHFGYESGSFRAWVDRWERRMWVSREMYETFRRHRIYPGARLRISARNEREYDIATKSTDRTDPIRVWRMWLDEEGRIQYDVFPETPSYEVDGDVYVADVRFEDLEALFRQAEEVGKSIFQLMWEYAEEKRKAEGQRDIYVTIEEMFRAIHYNRQGRMTSKATIAWELWRREAFEPLGGGRYLFRPEFGVSIRRVRKRAGEASKERSRTAANKVQKTRSLAESIRKTQLLERESDPAGELIRAISPEMDKPECAHMARRILIRYVPRAGKRTSQVHFTREIAENYFGFVLGQQRTIRLQQIQPGGASSPIEIRPLVYSESNRNCRIEVAGARELGEQYPASGQRPIIVFEEIEEDLFRYLPLLPGDEGYAELAAHLDSLPRSRALASDVISLGELLQIWPDYPVSS